MLGLQDDSFHLWVTVDQKVDQGCNNLQTVRIFLCFLKLAKYVAEMSAVVLYGHG
jgi:hypothetical protein